MCGILGSFFKHPPGFDKRLQAALNALRHRGPDYHGINHFAVADGRLALGHTRLSIIDLSSGGNQPMISPDGRYTIVFNGEIYNYLELRQELKALGHIFFTDSDTEVLLAAWMQWGEDGLRRLIGMFAFSVFDQVSETLTLVRDAFGIKPLFYTLISDSFMFASEVPALLAFQNFRPELNWQRAYDYLVHGDYDSCPNTFFQNVFHLMPGHVMLVSLTGAPKVELRRWWSPNVNEDRNISFEDAVNEVRVNFPQSIRFHLRSDVPLGVALSGGVDSSAVVCAMRQLEPDLDIQTFTYVEKGSTDNGAYLQVWGGPLLMAKIHPKMALFQGKTWGIPKPVDTP